MACGKIMGACLSPPCSWIVLKTTLLNNSRFLLVSNYARLNEILAGCGSLPVIPAFRKQRQDYESETNLGLLDPFSNIHTHLLYIYAHTYVYSYNLLILWIALVIVTVLLL